MAHVELAFACEDSEIEGMSDMLFVPALKSCRDTARLMVRGCAADMMLPRYALHGSDSLSTPPSTCACTAPSIL